MSLIKIDKLTKDYGNNKGVFDLSLSVAKGEVFGFLGPNGAGKTTTIRCLMGFIHPDKGQCSIDKLDCGRESATIQTKLGYLPGEIAFMEDLTGSGFIQFMAQMKGMKDLSRAKELTEQFGLDTAGKIRKMSKGMKQKISIVCAFMHDPEILILDEPTSGLDPLMQNEFLKLILQEKKKGTTIFMSSHMFEEVDRTCDKAAILKNGRLVTVENIATLKKSKQKAFVITLPDEQTAKKLASESIHVLSTEKNIVTVSVQGEIKPLLDIISNYPVTDMDISSNSLEESFMHYYGGEKK